jgi:hypothetical protein
VALAGKVISKKYNFGPQQKALAFLVIVPASSPSYIILYLRG